MRAYGSALESDSTGLNQTLALSFCLSMISGQTLRVCPEGKPVPPFPDHALILNAVAMQVVAVGIEPGLGALDMIADPVDHPPEPRRMIHLDEMRDLVRGEIVQHVGRREDQPPRERQ